MKTNEHGILSIQEQDKIYDSWVSGKTHNLDDLLFMFLKAQHACDIEVVREEVGDLDMKPAILERKAALAFTLIRRPDGIGLGIADMQIIEAANLKPSERICPLKLNTPYHVQIEISEGVVKMFVNGRRRYPKSRKAEAEL